MADGASACFAEEFAADGFYRTLTFIKDERAEIRRFSPTSPKGSGYPVTTGGPDFEPKFSGQLQALRSSTDDSATIAKKLVDITNEIQTTDWPYIPTIHDNDPEVVGANVTNVGISPVFGEVDLNTLAVKKG